MQTQQTDIAEHLASLKEGDTFNTIYCGTVLLRTVDTITHNCIISSGKFNKLTGLQITANEHYAERILTPTETAELNDIANKRDARQACQRTAQSLQDAHAHAANLKLNLHFLNTENQKQIGDVMRALETAKKLLQELEATTK